MVIHYFLVEFGTTGELYSIGCVGDKEKLLQYWYGISRDVRYQHCIDTDEREKERVLKAKQYKREYRGPKKIKLGRMIGDFGRILTCKFYCDKTQSITRSRRLKVFDKRYKRFDKPRIEND